MDIQRLRVSVGRTWRFSTGGMACADDGPSAYRQRINHLKNSGAGADGYGLPWPAYRSRFWRHMLSSAYDRTDSRVLVAMLVPFLRVTEVAATDPAASPWATAEVEAVRHPFGITTLVHVGLSASAPSDPADLLHGALTSAVPGSAQVRDGIDVAGLPGLPTTSAGNDPVELQDVGGFTIVSALHGEDDARVPASALARLLDDEPDPEDAVGLRSTGGAVSLTSGTVGLALPATLRRADQRVRCLHHNYALLLAYMSNLASLVSTEAVPTAEAYQLRAAAILNHLHRRAALPDTGSIYRSRLPELWISASTGLPERIDALAPTLPALAAPPQP